MEFTQTCYEKDTVSDIVLAGMKLETVGGAEGENFRDVGTVREQVASIGHLEQICLARSIGNSAMLPGLRTLQRELHKEKQTALGRPLLLGSSEVEVKKVFTLVLNTRNHTL